MILSDADKFSLNGVGIGPGPLRKDAAVQTDPVEACRGADFPLIEGPHWVDKFFTYATSNAYRELEEKIARDSQRDDRADLLPGSISSDATDDFINDDDIFPILNPDLEETMPHELLIGLYDSSVELPRLERNDNLERS